MTKVKIVRSATSKEGTFGDLFIDEEYFCKTGELPEKAGNLNIDNERSTDCIPAGTYECEIVNSPKFGRVYGLKFVPNRSHILIHKGNYCGDVKQGLKTDVEGCIILGTNINVADQKMISNSAVAFNEFMKVLNGKPFVLEIVRKYD